MWKEKNALKKDCNVWEECSPEEKSYEKDLKCLFSWTITSIEVKCDESVMEMGRNC